MVYKNNTRLRFVLHTYENGLKTTTISTVPGKVMRGIDRLMKNRRLTTRFISRTLSVGIDETCILNVELKRVKWVLDGV